MSVMSSQVPADFITQFNNLLRQVNTIQQTVRKLQAQASIVANQNSDGSNDGYPTVPTTGPGGVDPVTGLPLPTAPPILLQQGVIPVTDLVVTPGAYLNNVYADVTWVVDPISNALMFDVIWGTLNTDGTINLSGSARCGGNSYRILGLQPNTQYGLQVVAYNVVGQNVTTPGSGYQAFETTQDTSIPPPVSQNGSVLIGQGATSVIVEFQPLTIEQAPDVANGAGVYLVELTNDPTWTNIIRTVYTSAWIVAFNDIYPNTTLNTAIAIGDGVGASKTFSDLSILTPGAQFLAVIDDEYILFNAPSGNTATIAQRNAGKSPLFNGPEAHAVGSTVVINTQTTWYARVAAIDTSNNQGPWSYSGSQVAGGIIDTMIAGDISAAKITFGVMQGNRIEVNTLTASAIGTGTLSAATITLAGGQLIAGNPPTTGLVLNSQGITLYKSGISVIFLDAVTGQVSLTGGTIGGNISISGNALTVLDNSLNEILQIGLTSSGWYGIEALSPDGTITSMYLPVNADYQSNSGTLSAGTNGYLAQQIVTGSSTTWSPGTITLPSVRAYIGPSQDALITVSCDIALTSASGYIYLTIDGTLIGSGTPGKYIAVVNNSYTSSATNSVSKTFSLKKFLTYVGVSQVTAKANHTFSIELSTSNAATFSQMSLVVQPI